MVWEWGGRSVDIWPAVKKYLRSFDRSVGADVHSLRVLAKAGGKAGIEKGECLVFFSAKSDPQINKVD